MEDNQQVHQELLPWQHDAWANIVAQWEQLPHAILFSGLEGIGRGAFARFLARALLCETPLEQRTQHQPCEQCDACHWAKHAAHPDFRLLTPDVGERDGKTRKLVQIKIDDVRTMIEFVWMSAHRNGRKVVIIEPAESLNAAAANALLKVLEEPPDHVFFLLITTQAARLLNTLKSRCRQMPLPLPDPIVARTWLHEQGVDHAALALARSGGAPLALDPEHTAPVREQFLNALETVNLMSLFSAAQNLERAQISLDLCIQWLQKWVHDLALAREQLAPRFHPDKFEALQTLSATVSPIALHHFYDLLITRAPFGLHTLNLRLQLEDLLLNYLNLFHASPPSTHPFLEKSVLC